MANGYQEICNFLKDLACNPTVQSHYITNPTATLSEYGITNSNLQQYIITGNKTGIAQYLGVSTAQVNSKFIGPFWIVH